MTGDHGTSTLADAGDLKPAQGTIAMDTLELWRRYKQHLCTCPNMGLKLDISRIDFDDDFFHRMREPIARAYETMAALEDGQIANPDEQRMVGHYWLRDPDLAPSDEISEQIRQAVHDVQAFAHDVHERRIKPPTANRFSDVLVIGIGGSCLGPQLVAGALGSHRDKLKIHFLDNTDPDGFDRMFTALGTRLKSTLVLVISKSGGTPEPRNGMLETEQAFVRKGLNLAPQAVAITSGGSNLDQYAQNQGWRKRFPMWDWVGGRTSVMSTVGLVPAALQGIDVRGFLDGAAEMDQLTRQTDTASNPAALLALMWHHATGGRGRRDMVVLPYKDRLLLLSRYLQQLVMESLGKEHDLDGNTVNQGIAVYGNKGSTDQHAYVQQLRDGLNNFFATFVVVLEDQPRTKLKTAIEVETGITSGDYLSGFWQGTREALYTNGRGSICISIDRVDARSLGAIIALYERAVGFYATLIHINAYHQPGVEAGKKAAASVLETQQQVVAGLQNQTAAVTPERLADNLGISHRVETIYHVLEHLAANKRGVVRVRGGKYRWKG